jgi:type IV pilus assembly protein PilW
MQGFTLIELLVTIAIVGIMMTAVYGIFISNSRSLNVEAERVEIQQGQRIIFDFMARELRMAGYDRTGDADATIVDARANFIYFTTDRSDDGVLDDDDEHIVFCVFESAQFGRSLSFISGNDSSFGAIGSPVATAGEVPIGHTHDGHPHQAVSPIENIEFLYTLADGTPPTTSPLSTQMDAIRAVDITILARADTPDIHYTNTQTYTTPSGVEWSGFNDNFRRRIFTAKVHFRNMGL